MYSLYQRPHMFWSRELRHAVTEVKYVSDTRSVGR